MKSREELREKAIEDVMQHVKRIVAWVKADVRIEALERVLNHERRSQHGN